MDPYNCLGGRGKAATFHATSSQSRTAQRGHSTNAYEIPYWGWYLGKSPCTGSIYSGTSALTAGPHAPFQPYTALYVPYFSLFRVPKLLVGMHLVCSVKPRDLVCCLELEELLSYFMETACMEIRFRRNNY